MQRTASLAAAAARLDPTSSERDAAAKSAQAWLDVGRAACSRPPLSLLGIGWAEACRGGRGAVDRCFFRAARAKPVRLPTRTDMDCRELLKLRSQVGKLDHRCCEQSDAAVVNQATNFRKSCIADIRRGADPPRALARDSDQIDGRLFHSRLTVRWAARKRPASKSSAKIPIAGIRAMADYASSLHMLHSLFNVVWAVAWWSMYLLSIELAHLYKGRGLPTNAVRSFRPVG